MGASGSPPLRPAPSCPRETARISSAAAGISVRLRPLCAQRDGTSRWDGGRLLGGISCAKSSEKVLWLAGKGGTDLFCVVLVVWSWC